MAWGPNDLLPKPCQIQQKYLELVDMALPKEGLASPLTSLGVVAALGVFLKGLVFIWLVVSTIFYFPKYMGQSFPLTNVFQRG